ncbi:hypothetical protein ACFB49_26650 [Sphingomonas sp. DBB INV C78]|uniref:hypothetical protein n=1 Tax=Sphingomonas sp. DBB INV C78 TaxID=3349434 RepID=UPI0036D40F0C
MSKIAILARSLPGASPQVLALRAELTEGTMRSLGSIALRGRDVEICEGREALWAIVRRAGKSGLALRAAHVPGGATRVKKRAAGPEDALSLEVESAIGIQTIIFQTHAPDLDVLRVTVSLTPHVPLLVPFLPRDLYPLGENDDPLLAEGRVEAAQRGLNTGVSYFHIDQPAFGSVLYFQNFTALSDYFLATKTKPDGAVGGEWPEIGYLPPTPPQSGTPPTDPLPAGKDVTISDALLVFHDDAACDEQDSALRFMQMLGAAYRQLDLPATEYRDWVVRAERTLRHLDTAPEATIRHYGHRYAHPYTDAEYPDIMVQMSLITALRDFAVWTKAPIPLETEFAAGLAKFHDRKLKTMRRYLPNVGKDKDKDAVDSWYLYHPLLNLGRMAIDGDRRANRLFTASLDYAIKAAHHFKYAWPIQFKVDDFRVIVEARNDDGLGQTDVGGLYAYVMLQAYELTEDDRYLGEARAAIDAVKNMRFDLNYQANLTAWGASACMRLWRITNEEYYLRQSYVYLASFFHNSAIWESQIEAAKHYSNFLGVTCLHDAPYMAVYECFDSFAAFERYLKDSGPDLDPTARMLISEYCKYALYRAWFYYPDALPADILAKEVRNGHIDAKLSFPLEDLYHDGQPAGQVGQEIYGAGAAFVFASRAFHRISGETFEMFCDHFLMANERNGEHSLSFRLDGGDACLARLSLVRRGRAPLPVFTVETAGGDRIRPKLHDDRVDYAIPANGRVTVSWKKRKEAR